MRPDSAVFTASIRTLAVALLLGIGVGLLLKRPQVPITRRMDARLAQAKADTIAARLKAEEKRRNAAETP